MARQWPDHQVAEHLNGEGFRTRTGKPWTYARVQSMRKQYGIPTGCPLDTNPGAVRADGLVSSKTAAARLGVSPSLINLWVKHGVFLHDQRVAASKVWVRLTDEDLARLTGTSSESTSLSSFKSIMTQTGLSQERLWEQVAQGRYIPYRVRRGQSWQWHLKNVSATPPKKRAATSS